MKIEFDRKANAIYVYFSNEPVVYTKKLDDMRYIDYAEDNSPIGVELLCVSDGVITNDLPYRGEVERLLAKYDIKLFA